MSSAPERCKSCKHFAPTHHKVGACRRYPPTLVGFSGGPDDPEYYESVFPEVAEDSLCGEYDRRPGNPGARQGFFEEGK